LDLKPGVLDGDQANHRQPERIRAPRRAGREDPMGLVIQVTLPLAKARGCSARSRRATCGVSARTTAPGALLLHPLGQGPSGEDGTRLTARERRGTAPTASREPVAPPRGQRSLRRCCLLLLPADGGPVCGEQEASWTTSAPAVVSARCAMSWRVQAV